jgi:4-hydroxybenzoyl-CoA reductase subunit beta
MMRLPRFDYAAPDNVEAAAALLGSGGRHAMVVAGGTDLLPNMKRRQQTPSLLVGLRRIRALRAIADGDTLTIGAGVTLSQLLEHPATQRYAGLRQAVRQIATPHLRNMGTVGGNLCLDTRCNYYDQTYEWRRAVDFCMKKDGTICWVAPSSSKCLAVSSTDTAPMLAALGATVTLVSARGERVLAVADLYLNDGIHYMRRDPDEILTAIRLPRLDGWRSVYWKLRRRGAFDFPVLSVAAAVKTSVDGTVEEARLVLGAVGSAPVVAATAAASIAGTALSDTDIADAAERAAEPAKPMDNTDFSLVWRKRMTRAFVTYALRELRGDDMKARRLAVSRGLAG